MRRVLLCNDRSLRVIRLPGEGGVFSFIDCDSADDARRYLQDYAHDPACLAQMRTILAEDAFGIDVSKLDDWEVLDELASRVSHNRLTIAEELDDPLPPAPAPEATASSAATPPPELPKSKKLTYIELKVVWDENGEPVKNVRLVVKTPDGVENYYDTNSDGLVRIDELDEGKCDVRCDLKNARLTDTLNFVAIGEPKPKPGSGDGNGASGSGMMRIARIDNHKVKKGESIKSLADGVGMTWQDLSKFNWGTDVPTEINKHLVQDVGCTKKTKDGYNYMFDDSDNPGIVFIPTKWEQTGLATAKQHVIRVKKIALTTEKYIWIEIHDIFGRCDSIDYTLDAGGKIIKQKTSPDGVIEATVPSTTTTGELQIGEKKYQIEFLDEPLADDLESAQIRLNNLGYNCGPVDGIWGPRSRAAMMLFQVNLSLPPTGEADDQSLQKLRSEHDLKDQTPAESIPKAGEAIPEDAKPQEGSFEGNPEDDPDYFG